MKGNKLNGELLDLQKELEEARKNLAITMKQQEDVKKTLAALKEEQFQEDMKKIIAALKEKKH
jgi:ribosomal protein L29